ncbi:MAG: hypothetical protein E7393_02315 [Ruminococcaceae bacterium]|nr:hypothetical protein [Oscillospiraceae bacterium]
MSKKICSALISLMCVILLTACSSGIPKGISNPDGGIMSTDPPAVAGRVVSISDDEIVLMVEKVKWEMELSDAAQKEVARYKELKMPIKKGGFVIAYYENESDGEREVTRLEHLKVN